MKLHRLFAFATVCCRTITMASILYLLCCSISDCVPLQLNRRIPYNLRPPLCPELGNAWANENVFTAAEGIIWFRYHNYMANKLHMKHPEWSDENLFQNARKTVVATFQVEGKVSSNLLTAQVLI